MTCLGNVWYHWKECNKDTFFTKLLDVIREFAEEVEAGAFAGND
jgi:hypothetical protein